MDVIENGDEWHCSFVDGLVQLIQIDFRFGLILTDGKEELRVFIGSPFTLRGPGSETRVEPEDLGTVAPALFLFNSKVLTLDIEPDGELKIGFPDRSLVVLPDDDYEAWEMTGRLGYLICQPGGGVHVFR